MAEKNNTSDKLELVMDTVRDLILEVGIDGISMGKIAKKANVPVGNLYYWFENKTDLINKTYVRSRDRLVPHIREVDRTHIVEGLKEYLRVYIEYSINNHKDHMLVVNLSLSPIIKHEAKLSADVYFGDIKLSDLMEAGLLKKMDPEMASLAVVGIVNKILTYKLLLKSPLSEKEKEDLVSLCWDAIKA